MRVRIVYKFEMPYNFITTIFQPRYYNNIGRGFPLYFDRANVFLLTALQHLASVILSVATHI